MLRPTQLALYKSSAEYRLLRLLDISDVHSCSPVDLKRHANSFCLVLPDRTYYLQASGESDMQDWVKQVNLARESLLGTSTQNSVSTPPIPIPSSNTHRQSAPTRSLKTGLTPSPPSARSAGFAGAVTSESESEDQGVEGPKGSALAASPSKAQASGSAPMDPSKVVLSGYLMKCRSKRRGWRKRWFMLTSTCLVYSANHMVRAFSLFEVLTRLISYVFVRTRNAAGSSTCPKSSMLSITIYLRTKATRDRRFPRLLSHLLAMSSSFMTTRHSLGRELSIHLRS